MWNHWAQEPFSFDDFEVEFGGEPSPPAAQAEDFNFDDVESDAGVEPTPTLSSQLEDFSFDEAEGLTEAAVGAIAPATPQVLEGLDTQGLPADKVEAIVRETVEKAVWEVVPSMAEKLISEAIEKLKEPQK